MKKLLFLLALGFAMTSKAQVPFIGNRLFVSANKQDSLWINFFTDSISFKSNKSIHFDKDVYSKGILLGSGSGAETDPIFGLSVAKHIKSSDTARWAQSGSVNILKNYNATDTVISIINNGSDVLLNIQNRSIGTVLKIDNKNTGNAIEIQNRDLGWPILITDGNAPLMSIDHYGNVRHGSQTIDDSIYATRKYARDHGGSGGSSTWSTDSIRYISKSQGRKDIHDSLVQRISITPTLNDYNTLPEIKLKSPAKGVAASRSVANYSYTTVDSAKYYYSTNYAGRAGSTEYGGWLAPSTSGDSIRVTVPYWLLIGDSQAAGHPGHTGRLDHAEFYYNWPDSLGEIAYRLKYLTQMRWINQGIGGQTTSQIRARFMRDGVGLTTSTLYDNKGTKTLGNKPQGMVIIAGINDIFLGISVAQIESNLEWMASVCKDYNIRCVVLNLPGDASCGQMQLTAIIEINKWLKEGGLLQYGATIVDYNSWWNNPAYGNDNIHHTSLIADDIHPSKVGYDSLAYYIYRNAKLPKLTKAIFTNELSPNGFTGYSRPVNITINGNSYSLSKSTDTISINTFIPDSTWIKIISSVNITGTSYSGFSHIEWLVDNNPTNIKMYTQKPLFQGAKTNLDVASINITNADYSLNPLLNIKSLDGGIALKVSSALVGNAQVAINGDPFNSTNLSVHGQIKSDDNIIGLGYHSQLGNIQIGNTAYPSTTGCGIGVYGGEVVFEYGQWNFHGFNSVYSSNNNTVGVIHSGVGLSSGVGGNNTISQVWMHPAINVTNTYFGMQSRNNYIGYNWDPTVTSNNNLNIYGFKSTIGDNLFSTISGNSGFGVTSIDATAKLQVDSKNKGVLIPSLTSNQRDSIGWGVDSIHITNGGSGYSSYPLITIGNGGGGSGGAIATANVSGSLSSITVVNRGSGYRTTPTITIGGPGTNATATATLTYVVPEGLMIYNITTHQFEVYNGTCWTGFSNYFTGNLTDAAPTNAELTAILGTPASRGVGYNAKIKDTNGTGLLYSISTDGNDWYFVILTKSL
jgi:lysophospholipase L1-like esterase